MAARNADIAPERRIEFRIGIHQGDIVVEDGDIFGDGVNVAARLEGLAEPGGICVSARVQEDAAGRLDLAFEDLGEQQLKNIARPVRVYRVRRCLSPPRARPSPHAGEGDRSREREQPARGAALPDKPSIAVLPFQNMSGDPEQEYFADGMVEEIITALVAHPLAVRDRAQFELHLQGPGGRCEAGRARTGRALCARRLGAQGRQPGAHHRAIDRRRNRRASVGRPLRRRARRRVRSAGPGSDQRRRRHRAGTASGRDARAPRHAPPRNSAPTICTCARWRRISR